MRKMDFRCHLLSDVVVSENSSTVGNHTCLTHIPGACFLGASAARIYNKLDTESFNVFHSGKVRFGCAYPLDKNGLPTIPVPLTWYLPKGENLQNNKGTVHDEYINILHVKDETIQEWEEKGIQYRQVRDGFFSETGQVVNPSRVYHPKTAIDRSKAGRSAESQLFGYESLKAGTDWYFSIEFDADISKELEDKIVSSLTDGEINIGRSHLAEYGQLALAKMPSGAQPFTCEKSNQETLFIYCLSDTALRDPSNGSPTIIPSAAAFFLSDADIVQEKSYIRSRVYAPFNSYRRAYDLERQVICKGSVIAFRKQAGTFNAAEIESIQEKLNQGVGLYRYDGLGKVIVHPRFLASAQYKFSSASPFVDIQKADIDKTDFMEWIEKKTGKQIVDKRSVDKVEVWLRDIMKARNKPAKSQWSQLRTIALQSKNTDDLKKKLFSSEIGLCMHGVSEKQWNEKFTLSKTKMTYTEFLEKVVSENASSFEEMQKIIFLLGNRVPMRMNQEKEEK